MAIRLLGRVPIERIEEQAKPVDLGRLLMLLVVGVFYLLGFVARKVVMVVSVGLGWMLAAAKTGWQDAAVPPAERRQRARAA
ncbi:MAG TPA: hypothetical protein VIV12_09110 [Streptosporangiaceae bacterium]